MADPTSPNIQVYQVTRGSDVGTWDLPTNANWGAMDSLFANVAVISLTNANVTLNTPPNSGAAWSGPYQSQSCLIRATGTLTGNCIVTFPRAGFFIFENLCTTGPFYVQLASSGAGNAIGAIPGKKCHVFNDGTNMDYVDMPDPGTAYDLHGVTTYSPWMNACTVRPYLIKDGSIYNNTSYPALAAILGVGFGGTPGSTFGVPDERNRMRVPVDVNTGAGYSNRITATFNGKGMAASGGLENETIGTGQVPQFTPTVVMPNGIPVFAGPNVSGSVQTLSGNFGGGVYTFPAIQGGGTWSSGAPTVAPIGSASPSPVTTMPPAVVSFLAMIKTAILIGAFASALHMFPSIVGV